MEDLSFESDSSSGAVPQEEVEEGAGPIADLGGLDWEQVDERLKHAIDQLPDHYRVVLLLWAVASAGNEYMTGLVRLEEELLILLDVDQLFGEEETAAMDGAVAG